MNSSASANVIRPSSNNIETLINAGKNVEKVIMRDQEYPDLANVLTGITSDTYIPPLIGPTEEFVQTNSVPIPLAILSKMDDVQCRCFMGLLPEIGRAWLTIDHHLYIWSYTNPAEIYEYDDQDQIIVSVGLVKPKPNVFSDNINYLLILSTPLQIIPLALSVQAQELKVYATEMIVPADDVQMKIIKGTDDGRIFMIGHNGLVYEFVYHHPDRWSIGSKFYITCRTKLPLTRFLPTFGGRKETASVKSLAIDNERQVLYLLSDTSIEVVYLGDSSDNYKTITKNTTIIDTALQMCRQQSRMYNADAFKLESLHIVPKTESSRIHLMAMTSAGFRLYFTHYQDAFRTMNVNPTTNIPNTLELGHIRVPPPDPTQQFGQPNLMYRNTYYDCGICLSIKTRTDEIDSIHVTSAAPSNVNVAPPQQSPYSSMNQFMSSSTRQVYIETTSAVDAPSKAWSLAESRTDHIGRHKMKEIAQQLSEPPRQFMALTSTSIAFYNKLRPVDVLFRILTRPSSTLQGYQAFFERYGTTESCAMCLSVICNTDSQDIVAKATNLFFEYGGVPTSANASQVPGNHLGQVVGQTGVTFSGKHDGFVLYFARMVAPIWKLKVFANCDPTNPNAKILYAKAQSLLYDARGNLERLKQFMDTNKKFHDSANISDPRFQAADRTKLELDLAEQKSARELYLLLAQCIDAVYFIEFLLDSGVQSILSQGIPADFRTQVHELDISAMLTTPSGRELSRELVIATIGKYGDSHAHTNFDIVSNQLEKWCSSFFNEKDVLFFKGMEYLKFALGTETEYERRDAIQKSLSYFKEAADNITASKMTAICQIYIQFSFHVGVIELALERAQKQDPQNQAILAYESAQDRDETKNALLQARMESYSFALDALSDAQKLKSQPLPAVRLPISNPAVYVRNVLDTAIRSPDKLFHFRLYGWFMENGMQEELLTIDTPFLVPYFQQYVADEEQSLGFLWQYYRGREMFYHAAACLKRLAFSSSPNMKLDQRSNYIAMAGINCQCAFNDQTATNHNIAEFNDVLKRDIEACMIQVRVQKILRSLEGVEAHVAADQLDRALWDVNTLKENYGNNFHVLQHVFIETQA